MSTSPSRKRDGNGGSGRSVNTDVGADGGTSNVGVILTMLLP
jgi:hypothetical protein